MRFITVAAAAAALALPGTALAQDPVETNADQTACYASVTVTEGSVQHGSSTWTTPAFTLRLADHTAVLGDQDPCKA